MQSALISVAFASIIATQLIAQKVQGDIHTARVNIGSAQALQLHQLADAVTTYKTRNLTPIASGAGSILDANGVAATVADRYRPTVAELTTMGYLKANFNQVSYFGGGYGVLVKLLPSGCSYPNCSVGGLVYLTQPILSKGVPDITVLSSAIQKVGSTAGFSKAGSGGTINGYSGGWSDTNPTGNVAGILAEQISSDNYDNTYYRLDGAVGLTAALNAGNQTLNNIQTVASGSACTGTKLAMSNGSGGVPSGMVLTCAGGAYATQGSAYWKDPVANAASLPACNASTAWQTRMVQTPSVGSGARGYICNGAGTWQPLALDDGGNLTVPNNLAVSGSATVTGILSVNSNASVAGNLSISGNTTLGNSTSDTLTVAGNTTMNGGLTIGDGTAASASNTLVLNRTAVENTACSPNRALASDAGHAVLSCQLGVWRKAEGTRPFGDTAVKDGVQVTYIGQDIWVEDWNRPAANWTTVKTACQFAPHWRLPTWEEYNAARASVRNPVDVDLYTHNNIDQYYIRGYNLVQGDGPAIYYTAARPYRCAYVE